MSRGLRVLGHPLHALASDFPMVLLLAWAGLDGAAILFHLSAAWEIGRWALLAGVISAGLAAVAGFVDYIAIDSAKPQAEQTATIHMALMLTAACIATAALFLRPHEIPVGTTKLLSLAALASTGGCLLAGGWFGGHLVFHHGIGHD